MGNKYDLVSYKKYLEKQSESCLLLCTLLGFFKRNEGQIKSLGREDLLFLLPFAKMVFVYQLVISSASQVWLFRE